MEKDSRMGMEGYERLAFEDWSEQQQLSKI